MLDAPTKNATEMVFAIVSPIGVDKTFFIKDLTSQLKDYGYKVAEIRLSKALKPSKVTGFSGDYQDIYALMTAGNAARIIDKKFLALAAVSGIYTARHKNATETGDYSVPKMVYLVDSLKHPAELDFLKNLYGDQFFLLALNSPYESKYKFLLKKRKIVPLPEAKSQVAQLIELDAEDSHKGHGQEVTAVFHRADYFLGDASDNAATRNSIDRFLRIVFNDPYITPTFSEYAMHMAFVASTKSADMSRQVGAVLSHGDSIVALGGNDVPKSGGGTYWPIEGRDGSVTDVSRGRDYTHNREANREQIDQMISNVHLVLSKKNSDIEKSTVSDALDKAGITSLTEFGRMLHAEMDVLLDCARRGIATKGAKMHITTFPCHNCAKHIVGSGVSEVVFVEPYQKSKALDLHSDSINLVDGISDMSDRVIFRQFTGMGPRYYMALFSMSLGKGDAKIRKDKNGISALAFIKGESSPRMNSKSYHYMNQEVISHNSFISSASASGKFHL